MLFVFVSCEFTACSTQTGCLFLSSEISTARWFMFSRVKVSQKRRIMKFSVFARDFDEIFFIFNQLLADSLWSSHHAECGIRWGLTQLVLLASWKLNLLQIQQALALCKLFFPVARSKKQQIKVEASSVRELITRLCG